MYEYDGLLQARELLLAHETLQAREVLESISCPSADTLMALESLDRKYAPREYALGWIDGRLLGFEQYRSTINRRV